MIQPWVFSIEWENHCRNCIHNSSDYWCDKYNCCPCQALTLCNADGFHFEKNKDDEFLFIYVSIYHYYYTLIDTTIFY